MLPVGRAAPTIACSAVIEREVVPRQWSQLHNYRTLVLQFASFEDDSDSPDEPAELCSVALRWSGLHAKVALYVATNVDELLRCSTSIGNSRNVN